VLLALALPTLTGRRARAAAVGGVSAGVALTTVPAGRLAGARRAPFPVVVLVVAVVALLRLAGIHLSERIRGDSRPVMFPAARSA
jgi:hypothetical protein